MEQRLCCYIGAYEAKLAVIVEWRDGQVRVVSQPSPLACRVSHQALHTVKSSPPNAAIQEVFVVRSRGEFSVEVEGGLAKPL